LMSEQFYHAIGRRLRLAREAAGLTQAQVAERLDITEQAYSRYESGCRITAEDLARVAALLGRPIEWFYGVEAEPEAVEEVLLRQLDRDPHIPSAVQV